MRTSFSRSVAKPYIASPLATEGCETLPFRKITLADMPAIWRILRHEPGRTTDFSFGGVAMWVDYFSYEFCIYRDTLFIKGVLEDDRSVPAFSLPVGAMPLEESVAMLAEYCRRNGVRLEFSAVPEYALDDMKALGAKEIYELTDWGDYLYDASRLATLAGKKMVKKRNHVNRFHKLYDGRWTYEDLTIDNCAEALAFMDIFDREGDDNPQAADERVLSRRMLADFGALAPYMSGGILKVAGHVCAYTLGDIKGDTLFVHIEKATRAIDGSYEMINHLYAARQLALNPTLRYINREDDAGDEGLRRAKLSYHPETLLRKYNIVM